MPRRLAAVALAALVLVAGCSKDDEAGGGGRGRPGTSAATAPGPTAPPVTAPPGVPLTVTGIDPQGTKAPDEAVVAAVIATLDRWVAVAVVGPLHSGQPAGDLSGVFAPAALERLADPAVRATLVDEGLPPASTSVTATNATVALISVAGPDEVVALVAAQIDLRLTAVGPDMAVDVVHSGELVVVPEADGWRIESFLLHTTRDSKE